MQDKDPELDVEVESTDGASDAEGQATARVHDAEAEFFKQGDEAEAAATLRSGADEAPVALNPAFKWYVVHTYSGYENRAKKGLEERIKSHHLEGKFGDILIPSEDVTELGKGGQKRVSRRKFFPGYMLVQMELADDSWHLIKGTPKITGFVGSAQNPPSIPEDEVRRLTKQIDEGTLKSQPKVQFEEGENVRVNYAGNPFHNFNAVVNAVHSDRNKVRVLISIFGRLAPLDLDFEQIAKI